MPDEILQAHIKTRVSYQSKSDKDEALWRGTVQGLITYDIAKTYMDVLSYNGAVQKIDATVPPVDQLTYFLIKLDEVDSGQLLRVFANEWILAGSLVTVDQQVTVSIDVYDLNTNAHEDILTVLKAGGYPNAKIKSIV